MIAFAPAAGPLDAFEECIDAAGIPRADLWPELVGWTRSLAEDGAGDLDRDRLRDLVARLAALCDRRGRPATCTEAEAARLTPVLRELAAAAGVKRNSEVARLLAAVPPGRDRSLRGGAWDADDPPGFQSDWSAGGLLRTSWDRDADALALAWPDGGLSVEDPAAIGLELRAFGRTLARGPWGVDVTVAGEPLDLSSGGWACTCHHADGDGGFLELQWSGACAAGPVTVERQAFLSREGRFAVLSDAVRLRPDAAAATVEHLMTLPPAGVGDRATTAGVSHETREARLFGGRKNRQRARAFPLALPRDRCRGCAGGVAPPDPAGGPLTVRHVSAGGLVSPLVLDWHPEREDRWAEWERLTVTEDRRRLTAAHAVAHRLRLGRSHQLLLSRRTDRSTEPRAVLGHHHARETLIAEFARDGTVTPLLMV